MRFYLKPPAVYLITARYGSCPFCGRSLAGGRAIYLRDLGKAVCREHDFFLILKEFDNGYLRQFEVVDVSHNREAADRLTSELNRSHLRSRCSAMSFTSYTYMPVSEALQMRPRSQLIEE
ncbi:MAG: hypothetical protein QXF97_08520 [Candidatus Caldarchaeum sp.]